MSAFRPILLEICDQKIHHISWSVAKYSNFPLFYICTLSSPFQTPSIPYLPDSLITCTRAITKSYFNIKLFLT